VDELSDLLVGTDPFRIEDHFQVPRRGGFTATARFSTALPGIEQALWDVKGRASGVSVWELLGWRARLDPHLRVDRVVTAHRTRWSPRVRARGRASTRSR
jgi:L-alanine-DL-glutamate epimerase-like enolase superfamily enzyme